MLPLLPHAPPAQTCKINWSIRFQLMPISFPRMTQIVNKHRDRGGSVRFAGKRPSSAAPSKPTPPGVPSRTNSVSQQHRRQLSRDSPLMGSNRQLDLVRNMGPDNTGNAHPLLLLVLSFFPYPSFNDSYLSFLFLPLSCDYAFLLSAINYSRSLIAHFLFPLSLIFYILLLIILTVLLLSPFPFPSLLFSPSPLLIPIDARSQ